MVKILITELNAIKYFQIIMLHLLQEKKMEKGNLYNDQIKLNFKRQ